MSVQNGERLATKQDLADMYKGILPYLGGMPEVLANKFSKGDMYSTDEKMIGQWIDGKPLYQKVFPTTATMGTSFTIMISDTTEYNIADIVKCDGIRYYPIGTTSIECVPMLAYIDVNASAKPVYCYMYGAAAQFNYIILKYTKTTDSAILIGDDTDYSTEEKIVGTWIDGKPLYQKTITGLTVIADGQLTTLDSNVVVRNIEGITENGSPLNNYSGANYYIYTCANNTKHTIYMKNAGYTGQSCYITIQYTKTTT